MNDLNLPIHVGIIMDGNGRWAKKRGLARSLGHSAGAKNLKKLLRHIYKRGIKYVSVYAFSTENFKRSKEEVDYLMKLFIKMFKTNAKEFIKDKIKVVFSGSRNNLSEELNNAMDDLEEKTKDFENGIFNVCLNYGGRSEIIDATKKIAKLVKDGKLAIEDIDEEVLNNNMYNRLPDLDFVIRTSGEIRTSNFMPWQSTYAEYYFPDTLFPDFDEKQFDIAIEEFQKRSRRFGGV